MKVVNFYPHIKLSETHIELQYVGSHKFIYIIFVVTFLYFVNHITGVMVSMLALSMVDHVKPKTMKLIDICCFSAKHGLLRRKSKYQWQIWICYSFINQSIYLFIYFYYLGACVAQWVRSLDLSTHIYKPIGFNNSYIQAYWI